MPSLRRGNQRARNRILKQGGLYRIGGPPPRYGLTWAETGASPDDIVADLRRFIGQITGVNPSALSTAPAKE